MKNHPLIELRHQLNLDQRTFAKKVNLPQSCISYYERGERMPTPKSFSKLHHFAKKHGIQLDFMEFVSFGKI
jgi:DNA-binding transcriptional regulator YiaG